MLARLALRSALVLCTAALVLLSAANSHAGRCSSGLISGHKMCGACPDPEDTNLLPNPCGPGEEEVIFDLKPSLDSSNPTENSYVTIRSSAKSPCGAGFSQTESVDGYMIGCWGPPDNNGCRELHTPNNGYMCLRIQDDPLNCPGECSTVRTGQIAISTAGAADRFICPPKDTTTCKSVRGNGTEERFRLWIGGFCSTNGCDVGTDPPSVDGDTCSSEWGATLFGYSRTGRDDGGGAAPPGTYFWNTGTFDLEVIDGKSTCGTLGKCLGKPGNKNPWVLRVVGTPHNSAKFPLRMPCLPGNTCSPLADGDPGCIP
jgi:hypothetical protein